MEYSHGPASALVVHDIDTDELATAIGRGVRSLGVACTIAPFTDVFPGDVADYDLLVVGGRATSYVPPHVTSVGTDFAVSLRRWLGALPDGRFSAALPLATAFDLRSAMIGKQPHAWSVQACLAMTRHGYRLASAPHAFTGGYRQDIADQRRAEAWGRELAIAVARAQALIALPPLASAR